MFSNNSNSRLNLPTYYAALSLANLMNIEFKLTDLAGTDLRLEDADPNFWPYLVDQCFIYSCQKHDRAIIATLSSKSKLTIALPWIITAIYHGILFRKRLHQTWFETLTRSIIYTIMMHSLSSVTYTSEYLSDRLFFSAMLIYIAFSSILFQSHMMTQNSVFSTKPIWHETSCTINDLDVILSELRYGIGGKCLKEIQDGKFVLRVCMLDCDNALTLIENFPTKYGLLPDRLSYLDIWKIFSINFRKYTTNGTRTFMESGMMTKWYRFVEKSSYRNLIPDDHTIRMDWNFLFEFFLRLILCGALLGFIALLGELIVDRIERKRNKKTEI